MTRTRQLERAKPYGARRATLYDAFASVCGLHQQEGKGGWYEFLCPKCDDLSGHFGVNVYDARCHCLRCGYGGSAWRVLRELGVRLSGVTVLLRRREPEAVFPKAVPHEIPGYVDHEEVAIADKRRNYARRYLAKRGLSVDGVEWGLSREAGLDWRIIFPIRIGGVLRQYQARALLTGSEPKVINGWGSGGWPGVGTLLYNYDAQKPGGLVVLCEGPADAARTGGVALLGMGLLTSAQRKLLWALRPSELVVFLDADAGARSLDLANDLLDKMNGPKASLVPWRKDERDAGADPCDLTDDGIAAKLQRRIKLGSRLDLVPLRLAAGRREDEHTQDRRA